MRLVLPLAGAAILCGALATASAAPTTQPAGPSPRDLDPRTLFQSKVDRAVDGAIGEYLGARDADPLKFLARDMGVVVKDLSVPLTHRPVQVKQERIVSHLDKLIAELEKACKAGGGGGPNPSRPMADSVIKSGPGGSGEMIDPKQGEKQWGQLPPRQREMIMQSATEGFPPGYEAILQSYFRRLAQEQTADDAAADATEAPSAANSASPATPAAPAAAAAPTNP
jgi:hypothetical protein